MQRMLEEEFDLRITYMDLRFLLDDLEIDLTDPQSAEPEKKPAEDDPADDEASDTMPEDANAELAGGVTVEVDRLNRPGALMSGNVTFSDGVKAGWHVDSMGRLGLDVKDKSYRPTDEDLQDFQMELQRVIQSRGY